MNYEEQRKAFLYDNAKKSLTLDKNIISIKCFGKIYIDLLINIPSFLYVHELEFETIEDTAETLKYKIKDIEIEILKKLFKKASDTVYNQKKELYKLNKKLNSFKC